MDDDLINKLGDAFTKAGFDKTNSKIHELIGALGSYISKNYEVIASHAAIKASIVSLTGSFDEYITKSLGGAKSFDEITAKLKEKFEILKDSSGSMATVVGVSMAQISGWLPAASAAFSRFGASGKEAGIDVADSLGGITAVITKLGAHMPKMLDDGAKKVVAFASGLAANADAAQNLEQSLMRSASQAGTFGQLIGATGDDLSGMNDKIAVYVDAIDGVARATGKSSLTVDAWGQELMKVPGIMDNNISVVGDSIDYYKDLEAIMDVATGTQQNLQEVTTELNFAYRELGSTGQKALGMLAQIGMTSQDLGMPLDIVQKSVMNIAGSFKMLGDNSSGAIAILSNFSRALQGSGIGPQAIAELVEHVTQGINRMDIAHKAFVSGAAGGAHGLMGGYQMDLLMKQGKLDQVYDMVKKAMTRQMGGPIVSLEEAGQSQSAASQMTKQVAYLKQVAGIAGNDQEAYRILEVMKKGGAAGGAARTPEDAVKTAISHGTNIQKAQTTELITIQNEMLKYSRFAALTNLELLRTVAGSKAGGAMASRLETRMAAGHSDASEASGREGYLENATEHKSARGTGFADYKDRAGNFGDVLANLAADAKAMGTNAREQIPAQLFDMIGMGANQEAPSPAETAAKHSKDAGAHRMQIQLPNDKPLAPGASLAPVPPARAASAGEGIFPNPPPGNQPHTPSTGSNDITLHLDMILNTEMMQQIAAAHTEVRVSQLHDQKLVQGVTHLKPT